MGVIKNIPLDFFNLFQVWVKFYKVIIFLNCNDANPRM